MKICPKLMPLKYANMSPYCRQKPLPTFLLPPFPPFPVLK